MKSTRQETIRGLNVVFKGMMDSLFNDGPAQHQIEKSAHNFEELAYLISAKGIEETSFQEGFFSETVDVSIQISYETEDNDSLNVHIEETDNGKDKELSFMYRTTHHIDDTEINNKLESVIDNMQKSLQTISENAGVQLNEV